MAATSEAELMRVLHDEHARALWSFALALTSGDESRAEDIVQETLLRAWRSPKVLAQTDRSPRAWLFTVARNVAIDQSRSATRRHEVSTALLPEQETGDETDELIQTWLVGDALSQLSAAHRQVLTECYYAGRSCAEAARRIGVPEGTVKSRLHYALASLRLILQEMGVGR